MHRRFALKEYASRGAERAEKGLWLLCLGCGTLLLLAGRQIWVPALGLTLTATAFFWRLRDPGRIRSLLKWMIPVLAFLSAYGLLLYLTEPAPYAAPPSAHPLGRMAHLFLRSVGMIFAVFALEEALRPLAVRARAGGSKGGRMALMLGLSYQLVPVFLQSLEGVALSQRACSRLWWLKPSGLMRACSSLFLLSHRLSEEMALALSLRLRHEGPSGTTGLQGVSSGPTGSAGLAKEETQR
jgi:hypothetical protein